MSVKKILDLKVIENKKICKDVYLMGLSSQQLPQTVKAGQFFHVSCEQQNETFLRRPISVFDRSTEKNTISFLYKVVGKGTSYLAKLKSNDNLNILGPLGNHFDTSYKKPIIIGGGIGIAPLKLLARMFNEKNIIPDLVLGVSSTEQLALVELFEDINCNLHISTDEISQYYCGNSCQLAELVLKNQEFDALYACGPKIMLQNLPKVDIPVYISLEEYMACGLGACLGCAVKNTKGSYYHVCKDGPVFNAKGVIIDE